jgi:hypothetical protein
MINTMWNEIADTLHMDPANCELSDPAPAIPTIRYLGLLT